MANANRCGSLFVSAQIQEQPPQQQQPPQQTCSPLFGYYITTYGPQITKIITATITQTEIYEKSTPFTSSKLFIYSCPQQTAAETLTVGIGGSDGGAGGRGGAGGEEDAEATLVQKTTGLVTRTVVKTEVEYATATITTTILPEGCRETVTALSIIPLETPGVVQDPVPVFITKKV